MVSLVGSVSCTPPNICKSSGRSPYSFCPSSSFSVLSSRSYDDDGTVKSKRSKICACMAPPKDLANTQYNGSHKAEDLRVMESEHEPDVLIECRDVYKSFGEKHILRGVSFKIGHGEAVGIIGPSGTGKSTILKIMAGLLAPDKGEVFIRGRRRHGLISDEETSGLRIGLVFQSAALFDSLTVRENVGFLL